MSESYIGRVEPAELSRAAAMARDGDGSELDRLLQVLHLSRVALTNDRARATSDEVRDVLDKLHAENMASESAIVSTRLSVRQEQLLAEANRTAGRSMRVAIGALIASPVLLVLDRLLG